MYVTLYFESADLLRTHTNQQAQVTIPLAGTGAVAGDVVELYNGSTLLGTYTLLDEIEEGFISFSDLANVGFENAVDIGGGKLAYFQEGSLQLVVVPEPSTALLGGLGLAIASWSVCRRHRRVLQ